jgi:hypothetical protein
MVGVGDGEAGAIGGEGKGRPPGVLVGRRRGGDGVGSGRRGWDPEGRGGMGRADDMGSRWVGRHGVEHGGSADDVIH